MAKGVYKEWLAPENILLLQGWKRDGLTDEQIAQNIGVSARTLERWKKDHSQIRQALKMGKQHANFIIENELFRKAKDGNVTAMIFYLKNNWKDKYGDFPIQQADSNQKLRKTTAEADLIELKVKEIKNRLSVDNKTNELLDALVNPKIKQKEVQDDD